MNHTPGPWSFWPAQDARPHRIFIGSNIGCIEVQHFGYIDLDKSIATQQLANAQLIAAAPDLLEALQLIMRGIDKYGCGFESSSEEFWDGIEKGKLAIEKATGDKQ